jgi:alkylation response protein AidB-like acyl-CoA dehydrogenase/sugar lactone lactonase YvrE
MTHPALTTLSQEEQMFRDAVLDFARKRVAPHVAAMDHEGALRKDLLPELFDLGVMGIEVPEAYGGAGSSFFNAILAVEALATVDPSVSVLVDVQNTLVANAILRWGTEAQKQKYFPKLTSEWVGSYALSEPISGSDAFALSDPRHAGRRGLGAQRPQALDHQRQRVKPLHRLRQRRPREGLQGHHGLPGRARLAGFSVGKKEDKLGIRASSTCELILEDCFVPDANVLGEVGKGYRIAIETLNEGRIGIGAQMLGTAQGAFDYAMRYMLERKQFGQSIANFQGLQFQYARCAVEIESARLMVYNAARLKDAGLPFIREAAMAKLHASEVAERVASMSVEFLGGVGFTKEYPVEKFFRDAKIGKIYEGTEQHAAPDHRQDAAGRVRQEVARGCTPPPRWHILAACALPFLAASPSRPCSSRAAAPPAPPPTSTRATPTRARSPTTARPAPTLRRSSTRRGPTRPRSISAPSTQARRTSDRPTRVRPRTQGPPTPARWTPAQSTRAPQTRDRWTQALRTPDPQTRDRWTQALRMWTHRRGTDGHGPCRCGRNRRRTPMDTGPADTGPADTGPQCTPTQSVCDGACVETRVNSQHCGGCEQRCCAANVCINGTCNLACAPGNAACQIAPRGPDGCFNLAVCADLQTDRRHCGRCGVDCGADGFCVQGRCAQRTPDGAWIAPEQGTTAGAFEVVASNLGGVQGLLFTRDARSAYVSATGTGVIWRIDLSETPVRTVRWAESLVGPSQMTFDPEGRIVVAEREGNRVTRIVVNPDGTAGARTPYAATFQGPWGVVFDHAGRLLVSNEFGTTVDRIGTDGMVQRAVVPAFAVPLELRFDAQRNLFVGDYGSPLTSGTRVLVYGPDLTLARTLTGFAGPIGIALDGGGNVYVANYRGNNVTRVTPSGTASTYGTGLNGPHAIAFDPQGRLYVADYGAGRLVRFPATR